MFSPICFHNFVHYIFLTLKKETKGMPSLKYLLPRNEGILPFCDRQLKFSGNAGFSLKWSKLVETGPNLIKITHFFFLLEEVVIVTTSDNVVEKKKRTRTTSVAVFHGVDGNPLERNVVENITQFQVRSNLLKLI